MRCLRLAWLKQQWEVKANRAAWGLSESVDIETWEAANHHRKHHQWEADANIKVGRLAKDSNLTISIIWIR